MCVKASGYRTRHVASVGGRSRKKAASLPQMVTMPKDDDQTVPVTERALVARINRKLRHDLMALRRAPRTGKTPADLGDYYVVNHRLNIVQDTHVNLADLGRVLDCLKPWERLVRE